MAMCRDCHSEIPRGRYRCAACNARQTKRMSIRTAKRLAEGLCVWCGQVLDGSSGRWLCPVCRERQNAYARVRDHARAAAGLCRRCGKSVEDGRDQCSHCLRLHREAARRRAAQSPRTLAMQRDGHRCRLCHREDKLCVHHIDGQGERPPRGNGMPHGARQIPNNALDNLITLCGGCHGALTRFLHTEDSALLVHLLHLTDCPR
jgi:hypothetical protein